MRITQLTEKSVDASYSGLNLFLETIFWKGTEKRIGRP